ncbi:complex I subunit 5 family protein [Thiothrix subterranea]|uniref:Proton-conducting transporter membrane subunit n=1 Tax=Thiothrix subterranea TaxID=2735563 RepID=A0AA51MPP6_9GAMM|nr:proton-conducting transporter membrane subunit [Thiothrix subterranea]WML88227.1 proton-conducting transporter membrane subunit [Thiothrix subterranea]
MNEAASVVWVISLPLLGALLATVWRQRAATIGWVSSALTAGCAVWLLWVVQHAGVQELALGGWEIGLGISLYADGLAAVMVLMSNLVVLGCSVYARHYFRAQRQHELFWPLWLLLATALNALFLAGDLFNVYVTLELLGISASALTALGAKRAALRAALRYLVVGLLGSMLYLMAITLLYAAYGTLNAVQIAEALHVNPLGWAALLLMLAGLALKMALFPLHFWLPPAHSNAPAPVSAALSALVVKAAFYLVVRLWFEVFAPLTTPLLANVLGALGAMAVLWGSWSALRAERLKLLAAYSSVAQLGYLVMFFPLLMVLEGEARHWLFGAMVLFALSHAFAKSALFLAAGILLQYAGHDRIRELSGTTQALPLTTFVIALAGIALVGLPPSGAFLGKWYLLDAAFKTGQWWWVLVLVAGSLLATAYVFRLLGHAFGHLPAVKRPVVAATQEIPALALALLATFGLGLGAMSLWSWLAQTGTGAGL